MRHIRGFFTGTTAEEGAPKRPSRMWEILHPRKAEAMWAALEEEADLLTEQEMAEEDRDRAYQEYVTDWKCRIEKGNPPDSRLLDEEIERLSTRYPEISSLEREQAEYETQMFERGPRWSYPEYEGPGFTEPPLDWEGWHKDQDPGWTFTEWAEERGWDREDIVGINAEFPPSEAEAEYVRERDEREHQQGDEYERGPAGERSRGADDPYAIAVDEGRFVPTAYDLGLANDPEGDPEDECDGSPDRRGRDSGEAASPYDQGNYWPEREAGD